MPSAAKLAFWMRSQLSAAGARGFVVGLSGGVDSAVVARLAQMAAPGAVLGVLLPCGSDPRDEADATAVASHLALPALRIDLTPTYEGLARTAERALGGLPDGVRTAEPADPLRGRVPAANMKPRLRMTTLYFLANSLGYLVAGTGNRCELAIGYFTKYGDGGVDVLPLAGLLKRQVRDLAREMGLPPAVADRPASAGLWSGQLDEEEMGFTYAELERYLEDGPEAVPPALALKIERLVRQSEHKRAVPPSPEL